MIGRVYTASKMKHASKWLELHQTCPFIYCHARWLKRAAMGEEVSPDKAYEFWQENEQDIKMADCLMLYVEEGEHLRGGLVEAGMAIAHGTPVLLVGDHPDYGTWKHHPKVDWAEDLEQALKVLKMKFGE